MTTNPQLPNHLIRELMHTIRFKGEGDAMVLLALFGKEIFFVFRYVAQTISAHASSPSNPSPNILTAMTTGIQTLPDKLTSTTLRERMIDGMTQMTPSGTETPYAFRGIIESWNSPDSTGISALPAETGICDDVVSCAPEYPESSSRELDPVRLEKGRFYHAIKTDYHDERLENEVDDNAATGHPFAASRMLQSPKNRTSPTPRVEEIEMKNRNPEAPAAAADVDAAAPPQEGPNNSSNRLSSLQVCYSILFIFVIFAVVIGVIVIIGCLSNPECKLRKLIEPFLQ